MERRRLRIAVGAALVAVAAAAYAPALGDAPIHIGGDEAHFAVQAHAIATTGRDLNGRRLPLFVQLHGVLGPHQTGARWYQPLNFYLIAAALTVLPLAEWSIRLPMVLVALLNVGLMYALGLRLFSRVPHAALLAAVLILTPSHFIFARLALDYLLPVPFVLGWLLCLAHVLESGSRRVSFAGGLILGIGLFSYLAAWVLMPLLLAAGGCVLAWTRPRALPAMLAGFLLPALALAGWLMAEPDMLQATLSRYANPGTSHLTTLQRLRESVSFLNVQERVAIYWENLSPTQLFLTGSSSVAVSTRRVGAFLLALAIFVPTGAYDRLTRGRLAPFGALVVAGFLLTALPPTLAGERYAFQRQVTMIPFAVILGTYGVLRLMQARSRAVRLGAFVLLVSMPLQFAAFYQDYFGDFRVRSAIWIDPVDFRSVAARLLDHEARGELPEVYLSEQIDDVGARWGFYLAKHRRQDLWRRTRFFRADAFDAQLVAPGALLVLDMGHSATEALLATGAWELDAPVLDRATGTPAATVLRRTR